MVEYTIDINDNPDPKSRLHFLNLIEGHLNGMMESGIIKGYSLKTPYKSITIFKVDKK